LPTLFTALLARHGAMPKPQFAPETPIPKPAFASMMLSESAIAQRPQPGSGSTVIVIGAGFAGLAAANELFHAGYKVTVLEAQRRLGGRVLSLNDVVPGKIVEGGGELIGNNHPAWLSYRAKFGLAFTEVHDGEDSPIILRGVKLKKKAAEELGEQMGEVFLELVKLADKIEDPYRPWLSSSAPEFDKVSLRSWIRACNTTALCKYAVDLQFCTDNGVSADQQSMLGILAMVKGGEGMAYFTETERHRCDGGNQQLAAKLAEPLADSLHLGFLVRSIRKSNAGLVVDGVNWTKHEQEHSTFTAKDVILAVPPSVWSTIQFDDDFPPKPFPQMGKNVKCLMSFKTEYWKKSKLSPSLTSDYPLELTWHATEEQEGPGHALVGFSGADQAEECIRWKPADRTAHYIKELSRAYSGTKKELIDARFKNWPEDPFVRASYAFPKRREVGRWGPIFEKGVGNIHFAGEHTCYAYIGYMEGALQSGIRVSNRLAVRDGLAAPII
jgi:monoamine oxidase